MRQQHGHRRSTTEWAVRGTLAIAAVALGYTSAVRDAGYYWRHGNTQVAYALAHDDGRIAGEMAQSLSGAEATAADRKRADGLAQIALRDDPTAIAAVSTLGINAQVRGDIPGARRFFTYSQRLSRRDLQTHVWAIEDAVSRADIVGALHHYDMALRTSRDAASLLFPILSSAIAEPEVQRALVRTLAGNPAWAPHFIGYLANAGEAPQATARFFAVLRRSGLRVSRTADAAVLDRLIGAKLFDDAWSYYAALHPGVDPRRVRDQAFEAAAGQVNTKSAFDWQLLDAPGVSITIQRGAKGNVADFSAPPGMGGTLLEQLQMLPPGRYQLGGHTSGIDQADTSLPYWSLTCRDGPELGRVTIPNSARANGAFSGDLVVPAGCPVQKLSLTLRPSDKMEGVAGQIDRFYMLPKAQ